MSNATLPNQCNKLESLRNDENDKNRPVRYNEETENLALAHSHYINERQPSDILHSNSQKIVNSPNDESTQQGTLPPIRSGLPFNRPLVWPQEHHAFIPLHPQHLTPVLFPSRVPSNEEFSTSTVTTSFPTSTVTKPEYIHHQSRNVHQQQQDMEPFNNDVSGNRAMTNPSEFSSTTNPQENAAQFGTSLPPFNSVFKISNSNRVRGLRTCTTCNKWYTCLSHSNRHYYTTAHKATGKSTHQPASATMSTSTNYHHPQVPTALPLPEQPRSSEYLTQHTDIGASNSMEPLYQCIQTKENCPTGKQFATQPRRF